MYRIMKQMNKASLFHRVVGLDEEFSLDCEFNAHLYSIVVIRPSCCDLAVFKSHQIEVELKLYPFNLQQIADRNLTILSTVIAFVTE